MDSPSLERENSDTHPWAPELIAFYDFVEGSREFLKTHPIQDEDSDLISQIRETVEVWKESSTGREYREPKFDSAIYRDIDRIALFRGYLQRFSSGDLERFRSLIELELAGLQSDLKPRTVLTSTLPGAIVLALGLFAGWSALWAHYFGFDVAKIFAEVLVKKSQQIGWLRSVASFVFVFGGFLGIVWYAIASYQNLKQISHLRSLHRATALYLFFEKIDREIQ